MKILLIINIFLLGYIDLISQTPDFYEKRADFHRTRQSSIGFVGELNQMEHASFELCDTNILNTNSQVEERSIEETLVEFYLNMRHEEYSYNNIYDHNFKFLLIPRSEHDNFKDELQFELIYKFFFSIDNIEHCRIRFQVTHTKENGFVIFHTHLVFNKGKWELIPKYYHQTYNNIFMTELDENLLFDILVNQKTESDYINRILNFCKDTESASVVYDKLIEILYLNPEKLNKYWIKTRLGFGLRWWKKYVD